MSSKKLSAIKHGLSWNTINLVFTRGLTLLTKLVLTSFLLPEDFGLLSIAVISVGVTNIFSDFGLSSSLIQNKVTSSSRNLFHSAFWFLSFSGVIITIIFCWIIAPLVTDFYARNELLPILYSLGFTIFLNSLSVVPTAILSRRLLFKKLVIPELVSTFIGCSIAVAMAYYGYGVQSLVFQIIIQQVIKTILIFHFSRWRPKLRFSILALNKLKRFSIFTVANNASYYFRKNYDSLLIAKLLGASELGVYSIAFMLTETIRDQLLRLLNQVMYPIYSKTQANPEAIKSYYLLTIKFSTLLLFPISTLMILYSDDVILCFNKIDAWLAAIPIIKILSFASMFFAMSASSSEVLRAIGKPEIAFKISLWSTLVVSIPSVTFGVIYYGIVGASWAVLISYIFQRYLFYKAIKNTINVNFREMIFASSTAIISTVIVFTVNYFWSTKVPVLVTLLIYFILISLAYQAILAKVIKAWLLKNQSDSKLLSNKCLWKILIRMNGFLNQLREFGLKKRVTFKWVNSFYKIYLWDQNGVIEKEIKASLSTELKTLWRGFNLQFNYHKLGLGRFAIFISQRIATPTESMTLDDILTVKKLLTTNASSFKNTVHWTDTLPNHLINILLEADFNHIYHILNQHLSLVEFKKTTSHGDLLPRNILKTKDKKLIVIDWETFRENGSFIEDIATLFVAQAREGHFQPGIDICAAVDNGFENIPNLTQLQTLLLYSINRMYIEWLITNLSDKQLKENLKIRVLEAVNACDK